MIDATQEIVQRKAEEQARFCEVFSNAKRVLILWCLMQAEMSVGELAKAINTSLQNTSQHLRHMKANNIVATRREGQTVYYRLSENMKKLDCILVRKAEEIFE